jgi:hypothetical protein
VSPPTSPRSIALITGASSGLGKEFAEQLAASGHDVVLVARDAARLHDLARDFRSRFGVGAEVLAADLSRDDDTSRIVSHIDAGAVDILVNNAGFVTTGSLARTSREAQEAMLRVHVLAAHRLAQAAVQSMVGRGRGAIINVSSVASFLASPGNVNYCATKAYLRSYSESLAIELRGSGVYVQALCLGFAHTELHQRAGVDNSRWPKWMWMNADRVVRESLAAMRRGRPVVVIPGLHYRILVSLFRFLPARFRARLAGRYRRDHPAAPPSRERRRIN